MGEPQIRKAEKEINGRSGRYWLVNLAGAKLAEMENKGELSK